MKKTSVKSYLGNLGSKTASFVVAHANWQRARGRKPSESYKNERNPKKALTLAEADLAIERKKLIIVAVSSDDMSKFGCPHCGYRSGYSNISGGGAASWTCGECHISCCILGDGVNKSCIGFGGVFPELQPHPRKGIPSHGSQDKKPEGGGEFFRSRGIGLEYLPGCFVCGGKERLLNNIAAYVQCKTAGERIVQMFKAGARLDFRNFEPDYVQVKIGSCDKHKPNLSKLDELVRDGVITQGRIQDCIENEIEKSSPDVKKVSDLIDEMHDYHDVGVALQIQSAIQEAITRKLICESDPLASLALGEIRALIYVLNRNVEPIDLMFQVLAGKSGNPVEAALQFIEREMGLFTNRT